jgi:hypothetical protein
VCEPYTRAQTAPNPRYGTRNVAHIGRSATLPDDASPTFVPRPAQKVLERNNSAPTMEGHFSREE